MATSEIVEVVEKESPRVLMSSPASSLHAAMNSYAPAPRKFGNPGPLGLSAFGMTTALLNFRNTHAINAESSMSMIFAMGACFGGMVQVIAGILEFFNGNTFPMVAFTSYGAFWLSFALLNWLPILGLAPPNDPGAVALYLFIWGTFTFGMSLATLKNRANRCLQALFFALWILLWVLALGELLTKVGRTRAGTIVGQVIGVEGVLVGLLAVYIAMAELNGWPLGVQKKPDSATV